MSSWRLILEYWVLFYNRFLEHLRLPCVFFLSAYFQSCRYSRFLPLVLTITISSYWFLIRPFGAHRTPLYIWMVGRVLRLSGCTCAACCLFYWGMAYLRMPETMQAVKTPMEPSRVAIGSSLYPDKAMEPCRLLSLRFQPTEFVRKISVLWPGIAVCFFLVRQDGLVGPLQADFWCRVSHSAAVARSNRRLGGPTFGRSSRDTLRPQIWSGEEMQKRLKNEESCVRIPTRLREMMWPQIMKYEVGTGRESKSRSKKPPFGKEHIVWMLWW